MAIGYIYILSNLAMQPLLKIGFTTRGNVEQRVKELSGPSGVPGKFEIEFYQLTDAVEEREAQIHEELSAFRYSGSREFFNLPVDAAIEVVRRCVTAPRLQFRKPPALPARPCRRCGVEFVRSDEQQFCPGCGI